MSKWIANWYYYHNERIANWKWIAKWNETRNYSIQTFERSSEYEKQREECEKEISVRNLIKIW
jgi:hypothetical protein